MMHKHRILFFMPKTHDRKICEHKNDHGKIVMRKKSKPKNQTQTFLDLKRIANHNLLN